MARIVISENVTLDGVMQDPNGDEGFARGGWFSQLADGDRAAWGRAALAEAMGVEALLLGRRTFASFAQRWRDRTGPLADRMNDLPKFVVTSSSVRSGWNNTHSLNGPVAKVIPELDRLVEGDLIVYGSRTLVHALFDANLADELRLTVFPSVLGTGLRLFPERDNMTPMRLISAEILGQLAQLRYLIGADAVRDE